MAEPSDREGISIFIHSIPEQDGRTEGTFHTMYTQYNIVQQ